ncbi:ANTAR domain-containing response regulator [Kaarinaea lacus]
MGEKVLLIDITDEIDDSFKRVFVELGYEVIDSRSDQMCKDDHPRLDKQIQCVVVNMQAPNNSSFESLAKLVNHNAVPIVVFTASSSRRFTEAAAVIGLSAYIVNGFAPNRVRHIMDLAKARFHEVHAIKSELEKTRALLADRKIVEKAKGILMRRRTIDEEAAFKMMRKMAMDKNQKLSEVAKNIINVDTLFA